MMIHYCLITIQIQIPLFKKEHNVEEPFDVKEVERYNNKHNFDNYVDFFSK